MQIIVTVIRISIIILSIHCSIVNAEFIVTLRSPETPNDTRENYNHELINLALEKTKNEFGDFKIANAPPMNTVRSIFSLTTNRYENFIVELSYQDSLEGSNQLIYIPIPVDLGIVGYRVCFVGSESKNTIENIKNISELKNYSIAQGASWADSEILKYNGLNVTEVNNYLSIFNMIANNRVPLFCRGANELKFEYESNRALGLQYNESFSLFYSLPRFYHLNKNNIAAKDRIEMGINLAYADGSMKKLWDKHFLKSVEFLNMKSRIIFKLENPFIKTLPDGYEKYFYNPTE